MKSYLVTFKPVGPFFFGNEKGFAFSEEDTQRYFIKSEDTPSQSTILGALRYLLLPVKRADRNYTEEEREANRKAIGAKGFDPNAESSDYGTICKVSPLFIIADDEIAVATPFDHIEGKEYYTPFANYESDIIDSDGKVKYYTTEYNGKSGITSSYMRISDGKIIPRSDVFVSDIRAGFNLDTQETSYYKREYKQLANKVAFGVFITLDTDTTPESDIVYMGQGKSAFYVSFAEAEDCLESKVSALMRSDVVYCAGDVFASSEECGDTYFAITNTRTYRHFSAESGKVQKSSVLYRLIKAGSIFIPRDKSRFISDLSKEAFVKVGYNTFISPKEDKI